ncbi:Ig-like domain repeat protein, partial [Candidatus Bipolaricaulota bacterium]|nr:Ig-like domain repeat protein [Candidatus Bipolaricaulota bacterium]
MKHNLRCVSDRPGVQRLNAPMRAALVAGLVVALGFLFSLCAFGADVTTTLEFIMTPAPPPNPAYGQQVCVYSARITAQTDSSVIWGGTLTTTVVGTNLSFQVVEDLTGQTSNPFTSASNVCQAPLIPGTYTWEIDYDGCATCDPVLLSSSLSGSFTVDKGVTTTAIVSDDPDPSVVLEPYTVSGTVTAVPPEGGFDGWEAMTGTVEVSDGTDSCSAELQSAGTDGSWSCTITSTCGGSGKTITADYSGDGNYNGSSDTEPHEVTKRDTATTVFCSDTALVVNDTVTCTCTVTDTSDGIPVVPTGDVSVSVTPSDEGSPTSWSHTLTAADGGQFTFEYTPDSAETTPHIFSAEYAGSCVHETSTGTFDQEIINRAVDIELICTPIDAYIGQAISCQVIISDDTTAGSYVTPDETYLTLSDDRWVGPTRFSSISWSTIGGSRVGTFTYTPAAWDTAASQASQSNAQAQATATITATYAGSPVHIDDATTQPLTINLRPTETRVMCSMEIILVYQSVIDCSVTVEDMATEGTATPPVGTILLTTDVKGTSATSNLSGPTTGATDSEWKFDYVCTGLDELGGYDLIRADYTANDGIHATSTGGFAQAIQRRPTITTLSGCTSTASGVTCTATTEEDSGNAGVPFTLQGDFVLLGDPDETKCAGVSGTSPSCTFSADADAIIANVTVMFEPTNKVHLPSTGSENVDRSDQFDPAEAPGDASLCTAGCGDGGISIEDMIGDLNLVALGLHMMQMGLEGISIVTDFLPDIIVGAGFGVISGATIPVSDIASGIFGAAGIALEIAITAMTEDLDGDGLPGVIELKIGTSDGQWDSDGDGMDDADEISYCGGYFGGSLRPNPNIPDSDGDGLMDGYELAPFATDVCVADTDCDTLPDGIEVACRTAPTADNGFDETTFAALGYSFTFPTDFNDGRDQPNPREADTDGDALRDDIEFGPGDLATSA